MNINIIILWKNKYIYLYRLIILYISFTYWLSVLVTYRLPIRSHNSLIYYIRLLLIICMLWIVYYPIIASKILPRSFDFLTEKRTCLASVRRLPNQTIIEHMFVYKRTLFHRSYYTTEMQYLSTYFCVIYKSFLVWQLPQTILTDQLNARQDDEPLIYTATYWMQLCP